MRQKIFHNANECCSYPSVLKATISDRPVNSVKLKSTVDRLRQMSGHENNRENDDVNLNKELQRRRSATRQVQTLLTGLSVVTPRIQEHVGRTLEAFKSSEKPDWLTGRWHEAGLLRLMLGSADRRKVCSGTNSVNDHKEDNWTGDYRTTGPNLDWSKRKGSLFFNIDY